MEYADEPRLFFSPLNDQDYCKFYNLEMSSYVDDVPFYAPLLRQEDKVLELGCGTGRLTRLLARSCNHVTAIDHSDLMLQIAETNTLDNISYRLMDMLKLSFSSPFDVIVIPYNTINLLGSRANIEKCLKLCHDFLKPTGKLAIHSYHPDDVILKTSESEKQFQFAIFEDHSGGRVIKETLKWFHQPSNTLNLEERYRVRPADGGSDNRDLKHTLMLYTPTAETWEVLLHNSGFSIIKKQGDSTGKSFCAESDTSIFFHAERN